MSRTNTSGAVTAVTDGTFAEAVLAGSARQPVLVDFWAQWCPPCHLLAPVLDEIATELHGRLTVASVNADENVATAQRYGIMAMPTLAVFAGGEIVYRAVGARPKRRLLADLEPLLQAVAAR